MSILEYLLHLCFGSRNPEPAQADRERRADRAEYANGPRSYSGHPSSRRVRPPRWIIQASNGGRHGTDMAAPLVIGRRVPGRHAPRMAAAPIHG